MQKGIAIARAAQARVQIAKHIREIAIASGVEPGEIDAAMKYRHNIGTVETRVACELCAMANAIAMVREALIGPDVELLDVIDIDELPEGAVIEETPENEHSAPTDAPSEATGRADDNPMAQANEENPADVPVLDTDPVAGGDGQSTTDPTTGDAGHGEGVKPDVRPRPAKKARR